MSRSYNIVKQTPECLVVDDFLNQEDWDKVFNQVQLDHWEMGHPDDRFWHMTDGRHYKAQKRFYSETPYDDNHDTWFNAMKEFVDNCPEAASYIEGYTDFACRCMAYPVGSKNPWHHDYGATTYTYYLHKEWKTQWDGALLIVPKGKARIKQILEIKEGTKRYDSYQYDFFPMELFEQKDKFDEIMNYGLGEFVLPKPNRLILINRGTVHGINRVDQDAGENMRITLTGFFNMVNTKLVKRT